MQGMTRIVAALAAAAGIAVAGSAPAAAAEGGCQLEGTAAFKTPLGSTSKPFEYSFNGRLTSCQSPTGSMPASATITSNEPIVEGGITYQPGYKDSGTGACSNSSTTGTAVIRWADGTVTVLRYTTEGVGAAIVLQSTVIAGTTYTGRNSKGETVTKTFTTNRFAGATGGGPLVFQANPADCAGAGVKSAGIVGVVGLRN
jgi:hypothetical protein